MNSRLRAAFFCLFCLDTMFNDIAGTLLVLVSFVLTFTVARLLSRKFRAKRREREEVARRAAESRQVRRARERRQK